MLEKWFHQLLKLCFLIKMVKEMQEKLQQILAEANASLTNASSLNDLEQLRVQYLGKKGSLTEILKNLGELPAAERPAAGQEVNRAKVVLQNTIQEKEQTLQQQALARQLSRESIDVTLPGKGQGIGSIHPVTRTRERLENFFQQIGFTTADGPEIENEYYNTLTQVDSQICIATIKMLLIV